MALDLLHRQDLRTRAIELLAELRPRPNSGRFWLDAVFLLVVGVTQCFILPAILGRHLVIDVMTPWLAITFVRQKVLPATILAGIGACTLEMHSAVPAGLYLCAYWIMANVIINVRTTLSWRHQVPWVVTFGLCQLWVIFFESFVVAIRVGIDALGIFYWLIQLIRMAATVGMGMYLCRQWLEFQADEPVPS